MSLPSKLFFHLETSGVMHYT